MVARRIFGIAALVYCLGSLAASGQTATMDGVQAMLRGDDETAVRILRPRAEDLRHPDPLAQFYMASLYESGRGVARDEMRACALYMRAMLDDGGVVLRDEKGLQFALVDVAHEKTAAFMPWMTEAQFHECQTLATVGFDHGLEPATFALERDQTIDVDISGATITYRGKQTWNEWLIMWAPGAHVVGVEHTALSVGQPATRQHYIEVSVWFPDRDWRTWTLKWHVLEVVGNDLLPVTQQDLLKISAPAPPRESVDIHQLAFLHVDENGDPEWVVAGPPQRKERMETASDRQEQARYRAREAALAKTDWSRVGDVNRFPALSFIDADGCGNLAVYGWSADRMELITIQADREWLRLSTSPQTFDLGRQQAGLQIAVHVYERPIRDWPMCRDFGDRYGPASEMWRAVAGLATIELSRPRGGSGLYPVTIRIVGAEFVNAKGVRIKQAQPITLTARAGGFLG